MKNGWVYFIECSATRRIKIGWAIDAENRLTALQTGAPSKLQLLSKVRGTKSDEREMHQQFAATRIIGEWFEPTQELLEFISQATDRPEAPARTLSPESIDLLWDISPEDLRKWGEVIFGKSWKAPLARELGVGRRTIIRWAAGKNQPIKATKEMLRSIAQAMNDQLEKRVEALGGW